MTIQEYIQKDIERLEGKLVKPEVPYTKSDSYEDKRFAWNQALNTLIDIKRKELEELNKNV